MAVEAGGPRSPLGPVRGGAIREDVSGGRRSLGKEPDVRSASGRSCLRSSGHQGARGGSTVGRSSGLCEPWPIGLSCRIRADHCRTGVWAMGPDCESGGSRATEGGAGSRESCAVGAGRCGWPVRRRCGERSSAGAESGARAAPDSSRQGGRVVRRSPGIGCGSQSVLPAALSDAAAGADRGVRTCVAHARDVRGCRAGVTGLELLRQSEGGRASWEKRQVQPALRSPVDGGLPARASRRARHELEMPAVGAWGALGSALFGSSGGLIGGGGDSASSVGCVAV